MRATLPNTLASHPDLGPPGRGRASWSGGSSSPPALAPGDPLFQQVPANIPSPASPPDLRWNLSPMDYGSSLRTRAAWHWARRCQAADATPGAWLQPTQGREQAPWARRLGPTRTRHVHVPLVYPLQSGSPRVWGGPVRWLSCAEDTHTHTASSISGPGRQVPGHCADKLGQCWEPATLLRDLPVWAG